MDSRASCKSGRFLSGAFAGIITGGLLQPFDVLRTQQQGIFHQNRVVGEPEIYRTARAIVHERGLLGLWRGTVPSLLRVGFGAGTYFATLSYLMDTHQTKVSALHASSNTHSFLSGAFARAFAGALLCPLTVVKTRMEWEARSEYRGMMHATKSIVQQDGLRGLYRGLTATLIRDAPFSGFYVMLYTYMKAKVENYAPDMNRTLVNLMSGLVSGLAATAMTHPADTIKTRTQLPIESQVHLSVVSAVQRLYREEGIRGFFRGYLPRMMKRAGSTAVTWTLFEHFAAQYDATGETR